MRNEAIKHTIWCTICLRGLTKDDIWLSDDTRDGRLFCFDCAPEDAIRDKDTILRSILHHIERKVVTCKHCGWVWIPRKENPVQCPNHKCRKLRPLTT